ncbi:MAG: NAD(P)-dependent oxidoreductase [Candidatus Bathyarchaeia archaeon]
MAPPSARPLAALSIALLLLTHRLSAQALWLSSALLLPLLVGGEPPAIAWIPLGFALALAISKGSYLRVLRDHLEHIRFHLRYGEMGRGRKRPGNPLDLARLNPFAAIPFLGLMAHPGLLGDPLLWWLAAALALFFAWIWGDGHRYLAFASFPASILIARLSLLQSPAILIATPLAFALSARKVYWIARSFADWPSYSPLKALGIPRSSRAFTPDALNYALPYYTGCKALCGPGSEALYFWRERLYPLTKERLKAVADEYGLTHMLIPKGEAGKVPEGFIRRGEALGHLLFERAGPVGKARQWLDADERDLAGMASNNHSAIKKGIILGRFTSSTKLARAKWAPVLSFEVNVKGTLNVLEAARLMDLHRVIFISSTAVYGITKEGELVGEDYRKNPVTLYGAQKLFGEHLGENYRINYGLSFIALRLPIVYGPGQSQRGFSAFKEIVEKPLLGERAVVKVGGDQKYDAVYVKDVARSVWLASRAKDPRHSAFNIGAGNQCTLWDLAEIVKSYIPNALIEIGPGFDVAEPIRGPLDLRRAKDELGYVPTYDLERGVRDYIEKISGKRIG